MSESHISVIDQKLIDKFKAIFVNKNKESIAIICHDQPDPDCLACALGVQAIAEKFEIRSTIYYGGEIPYTQNSVMMNILNISTTKLEIDEDNEAESIAMIKSSLDKSNIIVVDTSCSFGRENNTSISNFIDKDRKPDAVIDHHVANPSIDCCYLYKPYGSCSTLMYELLTKLDILISRGLATALYLGISTDTADLKSDGTSDNDRVALESLRSLMDVELLRKIYDYPKPFALLELRKRAYCGFSICGNNLTIANVGIINPQQRALLAKICEEMLEIESIDSSIVLGIVDDGFDKPKYLIASFRTDVLAINVSQFMQRIFGKKYSGGRRGAGAAKVPLDDKLCAVLDFVRKDENSTKVEDLIGPFFQFYAKKIKEEKDNI